METGSNACVFVLTFRKYIRIISNISGLVSLEQLDFYPQWKCLVHQYCYSRSDKMEVQMLYAASIHKLELLNWNL